jgi:hypothetical protein
METRETFFRCLEGDVDSFHTDPAKPNVHFGFFSSRSAYDATQQCDEIALGDVIVIESDVWPMAVTKAAGALHVIRPGVLDAEIEAPRLPPGCLEHARQVARDLGYEVRP